MLLGEARSKCEHLAGAPLKPEVAQRLYRVTLIKGAIATTAIEGNTLTEEQAEGILDGSFTAPPSRQYQEQEVRNLLDALTELFERIVTRGENVMLTSALICDFNAQVLKGLELDPAVIPGEIRQHSVGVANYRGAPAEDCEFLVDKMVEWLNGETFRSDEPEIQFALTVARAVYAHLYLAWIHPFGDGNGRTARLVEFLILANCGVVPIPAAHLLSNHYNLTRDHYYSELDRASRNSDSLSFLTYAIGGFIDGIREVIAMVRDHQLEVAWINYVHERFASQPNTGAMARQRTLVLAMPRGAPVLRRNLVGLTPAIARLYALAGPRTLSRDLNHLESLGLIRRSMRGFSTRTDLVEAFLAPIAHLQGA
jgi:Fic family protein